MRWQPPIRQMVTPMKAKATITDKDGDIQNVEVIELETNQGRQLRICFQYADDVQIRLKNGQVHVRYFTGSATPMLKPVGKKDNNGKPVSHDVGTQEDEIPF